MNLAAREQVKTPPDLEAVTHPPLCAMLQRLLTVLYAPPAVRGWAHALVGRGANAQQQVVKAGVPIDALPAWIVGELEFHTVDDIRFALATAGGNAKDALDATALFTEVDLSATFDRRDGWIVPPEVAADAWRRIDQFGASPSIVLDHGWSLLCLWPLDSPLRPLGSPLRLDKADEAATAARLQQQLAAALGGRTDQVRVVVPTSSTSTEGARTEEIPAWSPVLPVMRLPGSRNHDHGAHGKPVSFARFSERRFTLEDLARALDPPASRSAKKTRTGVTV